MVGTTAGLFIFGDDNYENVVLKEQITGLRETNGIVIEKQHYKFLA